MRLTKKTIIATTIALTAPLVAFAQYGLDETCSVGGVCGSKASLAKTIGTVISAALGLVGVIFLVLMVYGGYLWMIARGNEEFVTKAKDNIRAAIIGVIIVAAAYSLTQFVVTQIVTK